MFLFIILSLFLVAMVVGPIIYSYRANSSSENILKIRHDNTRNPRYFSLSFKKLLSTAMEGYDGSGVLQLSTEEPVIFADELDIHDNQEFNRMLIQKNYDLKTGSSCIFQKEIYAGCNATIGSKSLLRAVACEKDLTLEEHSTIYRWADAEGLLRAHHHSQLGISTTSSDLLLVGEECRFKRLYAPTIRLGLTENEILDAQHTEQPAVTPVVYSEIRRDLSSIDDEKTAEDKILPHTVITRNPLVVFKGFQVQGDIRSHRNVLIDDGAVVHGNVFAEGNVVLGNNAKVYGNIFTQEDVKVLNGVTIGRPGVIKSVVARGDVEFGKDCTVYGYISTEGEGAIRPFA